MTKNRTYRLADIASKLGKMRTTVADWANQFREYFPTVGSGRSLRYTEAAFATFELISKMRDANKTNKYIKDYLESMGQNSSVMGGEEEKPLSLDVENLNVYSNKETMELRNVIELLSHKIEANKYPKYIKDYHLQDMTQKVVIAVKNDVNSISSVVDSSEVHLNKEVMGLRNFIQVLTQKINEVLAQDFRNEMNDTAKSLNKRYNSVSEELMELRHLIQIVTGNISEVLEQDVRKEISEIAEFLNRRYEGILNATETLNQRQEGVSEEMVELRSAVQMLTKKTNEALEKDFGAEIINAVEPFNRRIESISEAVTVSLNKRYDGISESVNRQYAGISEKVNTQYDDISKEVNNRFDGVSQEVMELRSVAEVLTEKTNEVLEKDDGAEINNAVESLNERIESVLDATESLNRRYDGISEAVNRQYAGISEKVNTQYENISKEVNNRFDGVSQEVMELHRTVQMLTEKTNEALAKEIGAEMSATVDSLLRRYDDMFELMMTQKKQVEEIMKFLTWNP